MNVSLLSPSERYCFNSWTVTIVAWRAKWKGMTWAFEGHLCTIEAAIDCHIEKVVDWNWSHWFEQLNRFVGIYEQMNLSSRSDVSYPDWLWTSFAEWRSVRRLCDIHRNEHALQHRRWCVLRVSIVVRTVQSSGSVDHRTIPSPTLICSASQKVKQMPVVSPSKSEISKSCFSSLS